ncbi:MAG: ABC transporter permease [Cyclobacteriaceae bacterium]|nr:ABC transporter permease [Cyclobacteriaceae bacterium]
MVVIVKLIMESFRFAWNALRMNVFRTTLSLLGVTVGIFAIIGVLTVVDSLEKSIRDSLSFLGTGVIYVGKWPFTAEDGKEYNWWDFWKRPNPSYDEYKFLSDNLKAKSAIAIWSRDGRSVMKYESNSYSDGNLVGGSYGYKDVFSVPIEEGRYFTESEVDNGRNVVLIGYNVAKALFPNSNGLGKEIKIKGLKYHVIGIMEQEGESFMGTPSNDDNCIVPYNSFRKIYSTGLGRWNEKSSIIGIKGHDSDVGLVQLEYELRGLLRSKRGLRPADKDNFALNRPEAIANIIGGVFDVLSVAGWIIGGFSILVGGFGIANIMFVSVRERTNIIGIQKSLGAKNYFVLFQFLFEAVFLSGLGGFIGLFLVFLLSFASLGSLELSLTLRNVALGIGVSMAIGMVAGIIPAAMAARMDPVEAIRA